MKKISDELKLANLALADESWESYHAQLRIEGLVALRRAKRFRNCRDLGAKFSALVIVIAAAWWSLSPRNANSPGRGISQQLPGEANPSVASAYNSAQYITEEQMLAMFPKGSCVLAELNGRKELVMLDDGGRRRGIASRRNER
jgi:hypothetical protein